MFEKLFILLLSLFIASCAVQPTHINLKDSNLPALIPVRDFVANTRSKGHYRVSPDGKKIAWKAVAGTREEIFIRTLGKDDERSLGFDAQGYPFVWAQDSQRLLFIKDAGGNENFHLFRINISKPIQQPIDLTPLKNTRVGIQQIIKNDPAHILITHNARDASVFDLYRLNIDNGEMQLLYENTERVIKLITNKQGKLQARIRQQGEQRFLELAVISGGWKTLTSWNTADLVWPLQFNKAGDAIYMLSNIGRDKVVLVSLNIATGNEEVVYAHPEVDVSFVHFDQHNLRPMVAYTQDGYPHIEALDVTLRDELDAFRHTAPAGIYISSSDDAQQFITLVVNDDREVAFYLLDRHSGETTLLGKRESHEYANALGTMAPMQFKARDGLNIHGYLTRPTLDIKPLPMVLLVHGGPFIRDIWRYNRQVQFLSNRGYAVLQLNYRGSSGYGRAFMEAAKGEFAGKLHDDLIDGVNWAIQQGIADEKHIAIMGSSYGGYATLVGLTKTPQVFACGIDISGPADLATLDKNFPVYWKPFMHRWRNYVGDPNNTEQLKRMRDKSPLYHAAKVERPLMIIQGANDVRVKQDQSDRMVQALRNAGKEVEYNVIKGEGHRISHWKNRLDIYRDTEDFLAKCLGGRSSGFDYYQLGSWLF